MKWDANEQYENVGVVRLSSSIVGINHGLDSPYRRFRRRVKRLLGERHDPARGPVSNADSMLLLRRSGLRELYRRQPFRLVSEAVCIVAENPPPGEQAQRAAVDGSTTVAP